MLDEAIEYLKSLQFQVQVYNIMLSFILFLLEKIFSIVTGISVA